MSDASQGDSQSTRMRVLLLAFTQRPSIAAEVQRLRPLIEQNAEVVGCDFTGNEDLSAKEADAVIVFGGDGSILRAARQMAHRQLPVIAVNLGKLGFLADISPPELVGVLADFQAGRLRVVEHLMFECRVLEGDVLCFQQLGLNEVAVINGTPFGLMEVELYVDAELATTYSCDGLIISTPVGSTAHSLSAGGPILRKNLWAFVISPISPHTLTNRPVVDSANRVYEMVVPGPLEGTSVVVDGRVLCRLRQGWRVRVEQAAPRFKLVTAPGHSYYGTLREKLGWGGRFKWSEGR